MRALCSELPFAYVLHRHEKLRAEATEPCTRHAYCPAVSNSGDASSRSLKVTVDCHITPAAIRLVVHTHRNRCVPIQSQGYYYCLTRHTYTTLQQTRARAETQVAFATHPMWQSEAMRMVSTSAGSGAASPGSIWDASMLRLFTKSFQVGKFLLLPLSHFTDLPRHPHPDTEGYALVHTYIYYTSFGRVALCLCHERQFCNSAVTEMFINNNNNIKWNM